MAEKMKYGTKVYTVGGLGNGRHKIMCTPVNCDMYSPITDSKMLRISVKRIMEEKGKQL